MKRKVHDGWGLCKNTKIMMRIKAGKMSMVGILWYGAVGSEQRSIVGHVFV